MIKKSIKGIIIASAILFSSSLPITNNFFMINNNAFAETEKNEPYVETLKLLANKIAPDDRIALFDIKASNNAGKIDLIGKVLTKEDKDLILKEFSKLGTVNDKIEIFPFVEMGKTPYAIVNSPLMNIRANPKHSAELVTQGIMGMSMKVIAKQKDKDDWLYVSMDEDKYLGWVRKPDVSLADKKTYESWAGHEKVLITAPFVNLLKTAKDSDKSGIKVNLTTRLNFLAEEGNYYKVKLPMGNKAYSDKTFYVPKNSARLIGTKLTPIKDAKKQLVLKAKTMISAPYLWGGSSPSMMDCSGLTQMLYKFAGYSIPRDADQQQDFFKPIKSRDELQVGDLVFFSENRKHATHVGMYIGNKKFIHSSVGYNGVSITSFDPKDPLYNPVYIKIYYGAGRIIKD